MVVDLFPELAPQQDAPAIGSNNILGDVAEFLACAAIAEMGHKVHHVPSTGYDLIADVSGVLFRIQCKGLHRTIGKRSHVTCQVEHGTTVGANMRRRIRRAMNSDDCDVIAVVAIDRRRVVFVSASSLTPGGGISVSNSDFIHDDAERISWLRAIESC